MSQYDRLSRQELEARLAKAVQTFLFLKGFDKGFVGKLAAETAQELGSPLPGLVGGPLDVSAHPALSVPCGYCEAVPGERCKSTFGTHLPGHIHQERLAARAGIPVAELDSLGLETAQEQPLRVICPKCFAPVWQGCDDLPLGTCHEERVTAEQAIRATRCPHCGAKPGEPCHNRFRIVMAYFHPRRL